MEINSEEYKEYLKEQFLNVHESSELLEISEEELWSLVHEHKVPTHNIAGTFLRFKKSDIEHLKNKWRIERELFPKRERYFSHKNTVQKNADFVESVRDFWYFNDFYVVCSALVVVLLYFIISSQ
ncbi:MAG: hypothetical protein ACREH5_06375 [Candidatus Omnitrophota bacterium]